MTAPSQCLTSFPVSAGSPLPPKSPTLWPTPGKMEIVTGKNAEGGLGLTSAVDLYHSPTPKSNPSPARCITGTFPIQSALVESRMLRAVQSLSDAVHYRLSSLAGFLASRTVAPGSGLRVQMTETFGASVGECLATFDPATHSLRMSQACLPLSLDGSSTESLATWPRCGMVSSGRLYQLPPLALPIDGNESGLSPWPSPTAAEGSKIGSQPNYGQLGLSNHPAIVGEVTREKLEKSRSGPPSTATGRADPAKRSTDGNRPELWGTPSVTETGGPTGLGGGSGNKKKMYRFGEEGRQMCTAKLNPHWVMTLMGYPPLWAELGRKFTTASRNSKAQATPSCQSVPPSSSTQSGGN
jgi:hypothetical protein